MLVPLADRALTSDVMLGYPADEVRVGAWGTAAGAWAPSSRGLDSLRFTVEPLVGGFVSAYGERIPVLLSMMVASSATVLVLESAPPRVRYFCAEFMHLNRLGPLCSS